MNNIGVKGQGSAWELITLGRKLPQILATGAESDRPDMVGELDSAHLTSEGSIEKGGPKTLLKASDRAQASGIGYIDREIRP